MRATGDTPPSYHSYLLRLWRESEYGAWRASLESVTTGERHGFGSLSTLIAFLEAECQAMAAYHQQDLGGPEHSSKEPGHEADNAEKHLAARIAKGDSLS